MKTVVVGLSGGVDSSVAAYLCLQKGYRVIGVFMKNWHDDSVTISNECPWLEDSNDAMLVADKLDIPFQTVDLSKEYKTKIVDYMFEEYKNGRTPNPDVLCNREIKFDVFLKVAETLGADYVVTGHYCRKEEIKNTSGQSIYRLLSGKDLNKDQSYFLCQVTQKQLSKILFPVGELQKSEVRKIALEQGLVTANKKDSQGLCFIGKVKLPEFLQQQLKPKKGKVYEIPDSFDGYSNSTYPTIQNYTHKHTYSEEDGVYKGDHNGAHFYTKGQRKGLHIGGTKEPLFVIDTDVKENIVYVGQGKSHPGLRRKGLIVLPKDQHWIREDYTLKLGEQKVFSVRIRYRQPLQKATLYQKEDGLYVIFEKMQTAIAEGQFVAWYIDEELIGSGIIH